MTVNKNIDAQEYKQTLKNILPVQFEPGSLADRLLIQGREEGREKGEQIGLKKGKIAGKILTLQEILGDTSTTDDEFKNCDIDTLTTRLAELQQRLRPPSLTAGALTMPALRLRLLSLGCRWSLLQAATRLRTSVRL